LSVPLALWGGAECTINRVGDRYRDQLVLTGHDIRPTDLDRFADLGLEALRYPLLWETFAKARDPEPLWAWHGERLDRLQMRGIKPIIGLIHHGSGPATTNILASDFATGLADHAREAARRFSWIDDWTPVNEPLTTARFSALYGHWYPHARDERSFWLGLLNQIDGVRLSMAAIRAVNPGARLIQTEDMGNTASTTECADQAAFDNLRRWASWDMLAGKFAPDHPFWPRLAAMGFEARLEAMATSPCRLDVLGLNHYLTSDRYLDHRLERYPAAATGSSPLGAYADIEAVRIPGCSRGIEGALRESWERYQIPIALTEVHNGCTREEQMRWLKEAWDTAVRLRSEGVAIEAVTPWSLLGSFDWNSLLTCEANHYESGVFDMRGPAPRPTALAPLIKTLAAGKQALHPVLDRTGWWRSHGRAAPNKTPTPPLLILGATGTLGQAFAGGCRLRGIDHVLTDRQQLDLLDPASVNRVLDDVMPWAVINCAGWVRVDEAERNAQACDAANYTGSVALAAACCARDIHYTGFSSDLVFDGLKGRPYVESDPPAPLSVYGSGKAKVDDALRSAPGRALIIRTASFFSPFDTHNFAMHLVASLRQGQPFMAASDVVTSPTYVPDLVRTTLDLIIDDEIGLWHLVNDGALSWYDFAVEIAQAMRLPAQLIIAKRAEEMSWSARRPLHAGMTSERGLIMPPLACAIERFVNELGGASPIRERGEEAGDAERVAHAEASNGGSACHAMLEEEA